MATVLTVFSGKGGTGKSLVATNLACGFKMDKYKTLLIDFAFGIRNDDVLIGVTDSVLYNVGDVLSGNCSAEDAIVVSEKDYVPDFLASSVSGFDGDKKKSVKKMLKSISGMYDRIVFDCTAASGSEFEVCAGVSDVLLGVCGDDCFSVSNTALCMHRIKALSPDKTYYLIINNVEITNDADDMEAEQIVDEIGVKLIGIIPNDKYVFTGMKNGDPIIRYESPAGIELEMICKRLNGDEVSSDVYRKKYKSIFNKISWL